MSATHSATHSATDSARSGPDTLAAALLLLADTLVRITTETRHVMIVTDAAGQVLWPDSRRYHRWTAAACPVRDPGTGTVIGAVDVAGPVLAFHPTTLELVRAAARLAEGLLAAQRVRDELLPTPLPS